jgi:hypothetical protein
VQSKSAEQLRDAHEKIQQLEAQVNFLEKVVKYAAVGFGVLAVILLLWLL